MVTRGFSRTSRADWRRREFLRLAAIRFFVALAVFAVLPAPGRADLLVASLDTGQVLRYDDVTGAFQGVFATGLPDDHPIGLTMGPDDNLYVAVYNIGTAGGFVRPPLRWAHWRLRG